MNVVAIYLGMRGGNTWTGALTEEDVTGTTLYESLPHNASEKMIEARNMQTII